MIDLMVMNLDQVAQKIFDDTHSQLNLATPLGLGKPNQLLNLIYQRFKTQSHKKLNLYTALSLDFPEAKTSIEKRFLNPFLERHYGPNYPRLEYVRDLKSGKLPDNIEVYEFYFQAGQYKRNFRAQSSAVSLNYTHVARSLLDQDIHMTIQLVSERGGKLSLSCNSDVVLDLDDLYKSKGKKLKKIAVVHPKLPFLGGDAEVHEDYFDLVVRDPQVDHELFALPLASVDEVDHLIGFHASQLVKDDGTLQIGIGSLSDALVSSLLVRQNSSAKYKGAAAAFWQSFPAPHELSLHQDPLVDGLYGTSEMMMDGFMHLRRAGILKRKIFDLDEHRKRYMHAAFYLGSKKFYQWLHELSGEDFDGLSMTRVSKVNDLYDTNEWALRRQRKNARFFNTCMKVTCLGGAVPDTLENGEVISGIGGQFNFVAMSQELLDSRSVLMLRSTYSSQGLETSSIVTESGHLSIPRHLRDIVITEYGIANLRGKTDGEVLKALIGITDVRFQDKLARYGIENFKLPKDYKVPTIYRNNTRENILNFVKNHRDQNLFNPEPFGTDFTAVEQNLKAGLGNLRGASKLKLTLTLARGFFKSSKPHTEELVRMKLDQPRSLTEFLEQRMVLGALGESK